VDLLRLNTLRGTKTAFLAPESYDEHPCPFYLGVHPDVKYDLLIRCVTALVSIDLLKCLHLPSNFMLLKHFQCKSIIFFYRSINSKLEARELSSVLSCVVFPRMSEQKLMS